MKDCYIIGLTGPTGAGKSAAAEIFEKLGCFHIDADKSARAVTAPGSLLLPLLAAEFGGDIINSDGELDRRMLASRAFANPAATQKLNELSFPFITERVGRSVEEAKAGHKFILLDAPTLFESGADRMCDISVAVLCPADIRRARIIERDGLTEEQADTRISAGKPDGFYLDRCRYIIYNSGVFAEFADLVTDTAKKIMREAEEV